MLIHICTKTLIFLFVIALAVCIFSVINSFSSTAVVISLSKARPCGSLFLQAFWPFSKYGHPFLLCKLELPCWQNNSQSLLFLFPNAANSLQRFLRDWGSRKRWESKEKVDFTEAAPLGCTKQSLSRYPFTRACISGDSQKSGGGGREDREAAQS